MDGDRVLPKEGESVISGAHSGFKVSLRHLREDVQ